ncbi:hypothetical protein HZ326_24076 [Fusarium oxysporum f. sp. albedinis]|nr:hypothetical protein HZ326_24076 [Fusarium oxysporum f. sp. albedinis]
MRSEAFWHGLALSMMVWPWLKTHQIKGFLVCFWLIPPMIGREVRPIAVAELAIILNEILYIVRVDTPKDPCSVYGAKNTC